MKSKIIPILAITLLGGAPAFAESHSEDKGKPNAQMQAVLDQHMALEPKPIETLSAQEARKQPTIADAVKALLKKQGKSAEPEPVGDVAEKSVSSSGGKIPIRIYTPKGEGPFPVIVYYHGGGWVIADLDTYDASARALANAANAVVVSSHYRQAPEHAFPAAHEDALAAYEWTLSNARSIKGDPSRIAVAGESAGGNLAAAVCLMAKDKKIQMPVHQLLVYPIANHGFDTASYKEHHDAKPLNASMMRWFFAKYLKTPEDGNNTLISLVRNSGSELRGLPTATVITADVDVLRAEGKEYAEKLGKAGVRTHYKNYPGVAHEFFGTGAVVDTAKDAVALAAKDLKQAFQGGAALSPTGREK